MVQGAKAPCQGIFMALYNDLLTFTQCEMGTKLIKRHGSLIKVSALFIIF